MDHEMFAPQVARFAPEHRCITVATRFHGQTDSPDEPFTVQDAVDDLVAVLDHLGVAEAILVGFSFGGWISVRLALRHPERVLGLAIVDSYERMESPEEITAYRGFKDAILAGGFGDEMVANMRGFLFGPGYDTDRWVAKWRARPPRNWNHPYEAMFARDDVNHRLGEIACPAIVFHGEGNPANPPEVSKDLAARIGTGASLVVVPGAGHTSNLEAPDHVNRELAAFFASVTG
jgi:pimeloyl-ACP methyl ester carboxylesterase